MTMYSANNFILEMETTDGSGEYVPIAFVRSNDVSSNNGTRERTDKTDGREQNLGYGGQASLDFSGEGVTSSHANFVQLARIHHGFGIDNENKWRFRTIFVDNNGNTIKTWQSVFYMPDLELSEPVQDMVSFSISLQSSGEFYVGLCGRGAVTSLMWLRYADANNLDTNSGTGANPDLITGSPSQFETNGCDPAMEFNGSYFDIDPFLSQYNSGSKQWFAGYFRTTPASQFIIGSRELGAENNIYVAAFNPSGQFELGTEAVTNVFNPLGGRHDDDEWHFYVFEIILGTHIKWYYRNRVTGEADVFTQAITATVPEQVTIGVDIDFGSPNQYWAGDMSRTMIELNTNLPSNAEEVLSYFEAKAGQIE